MSSSEASRQASKVWLSWSGSKDLRRAANEIVGRDTMEADPQITSDRDPIFEEQVANYGWPEGYDPEQDAIDLAPYNHDMAAEMLNQLARGGPRLDALQRVTVGGPAFRGYTIPLTNLDDNRARVAPGQIIDVPLMAVTDDEVYRIGLAIG